MFKQNHKLMELIFTFFLIFIALFEVLWGMSLFQEWYRLHIVSILGNIVGMFFLPIASLIVFCDVFGYLKRPKKQKFNRYIDTVQKS